MNYDHKPFEDVIETGDGFTLPILKWRELLFIGAVRQEGDAYRRDPTRPMPPFARGEVFPPDASFSACTEGARVRLRRLRRG